MSDRRPATLRATLAFLQLPPRAPELRLLHRWLDSWTDIVAGSAWESTAWRAVQRAAQGAVGRA